VFPLSILARAERLLGVHSEAKADLAVEAVGTV